MTETLKEITVKAKETEKKMGMYAAGALKLPSSVSKLEVPGDAMLWHHRLGHIPFERMERIEGLAGLKKRNTQFCLICPEAKQTKQPFRRSNSGAAEIFELIHIDIWGPYRVQTRHHHRYFMTLVDDHSRVTWVHLMRLKSEAVQVIKEFILMAKNQFRKEVRRIRSDNALEFQDKECEAMYKEMGIKHETSCVETPEQNGRVERKHRNILEMSRALRFQAGVPLQFWGDCVLAVVYITNKLPTNLHGGKSTYEEHVYMEMPPGYTGEGSRIQVQGEGESFNAGNNFKQIQDAKALLARSFHMKDMGPLKFFLGIEVDRSKEGIFLSQSKYIKDLLHEYHMLDCRPVKLPLDINVKLTSNQGDPLPVHRDYQKLVGKLIYLTITRPDLAYSVHVLSQFMHSPTTVHMQSAKRLLRYLRGTMNQGVLMANQTSAHLTAFCDSDWAGCPDTRKSTSGFCLFLGSSPISWKSKRQIVVARSSVESEYRCIAHTMSEIIWLKQLLKDLGIKYLSPTEIKCDNQAAIAMTANPVKHERSKHIEIDAHFIRDKAKAGEIRPTYTPSSHQVADIFTKILPVAQHRRLLSKMSV